VSNALPVILFNYNPTALFLTNTVTIPVGSNSASFPIETINNGELDGTRTVLITANADGYVPASATLTITDDDTPARRTIGGRLSGNLDQADYQVIADLTVMRGQSLALAAGSTLFFGPGRALNVDGTLLGNANGLPTIRFTSSLVAPTNGSWLGITVTSSGQPQTVLNNVEIAYARDGLVVQPTGSLPSLLLTHSRVQHCSQDGVRVYAMTGITINASAVQVATNQVFLNGRYGIHLWSHIKDCGSSRNSSPVLGNEVWGNASAGIYLRASADNHYGCADVRRSRVDSVVAKNFIHGNTWGIRVLAEDGFIILGAVNAAIQNNLIINDTQDGLRLEAEAGSSELLPNVANNTLAGNGGAGIWHTADVDAGFTLVNNIVIGNREGIQAGTNFTGTNFVVSYNDVAGNVVSNWHNYPPAYGFLTTTNLNGTPADAYQNLSTDPRFAGPTDFHLAAGSPAVDAGTTNSAPTLDFEDQARLGPVDMGCDELSAPLLTLTRSTSGEAVRLVTTGGRGRSYLLDGSTDFQTWTPVTSFTMTNGITPLEIPLSSTQPFMFYRLKTQ
jgi:hypothetical protein